MRAMAFGTRCRRELLRDPVSLFFSVGLPVALLAMMHLIQRSIGDGPAIFDLPRFTPGIALFSLAFLSMFAAMLLAGDRDSAYLTRLYASPMQAADFLAGYCLPLLPLGLAQGAVCFLAAFCLGLRDAAGALRCLLAMVPVILLFIALGLLLGSILRGRQVGAIASILVQVVALSSGMWFDLELIGGGFRTVCRLLPFARALELIQRAMAGSAAGAAENLAWVLGYAAAISAAAVLLFRRQMRG
ncbi:MAG: ABC transporter permease [Oscillospiraceae bacterium]|nr:ABC transporter permease [Oscillospiraceae bacterium]